MRKQFAAVLMLLFGVVAISQTAEITDSISLPDGFTIEIWSDEVPNARSMALGDNGTVFVGSGRAGSVYALVPVDSRDSTKMAVLTIASGLGVPNGLAFHDGDLYVAETRQVTRFIDIENRLENPPEPEIVVDSLPGESHHGSRYIKFGPDGKLYITIGAPCNICRREGFGNISRLNADGSGLEIFAEGVRNSVGLTWDAKSGDLWFTDNGRDMLGDDLPPGELNRAATSGLHFGFPYCHGGTIADPVYGKKELCDEFTAPRQQLGAHVAPLGLTFYSGNMFPAEYQGQLFIAEHGSWNRSEKSGYRISLVRIVKGEAQGYETFAEGWLQGENVFGRPVDLLVLPDGSMLVSDDMKGRIYRISYSRY